MLFKKLSASVLILGASLFYLFSRPSSGSVSAASGVAMTSSVPAPSQATPPTARLAASASQTPVKKSPYKDGVFTGNSADAYYGLVKVQATIRNGSLSNVAFLSYPNSHSTSLFINGQAMPMLTQEAISAQSANVDIISGATETSLAFRQSLAEALLKAKS